MSAGDIYSIAGDGSAGFSGAGGPAAAAGLPPDAVAIDSAGNLVISDDGNNRVRVVAEHTGSYYGQPMTPGDIYTVAGDGTDGCSGDGGPAPAAAVGAPDGVAVSPGGSLLIAEHDSDRIQAVAG